MTTTITSRRRARRRLLAPAITLVGGAGLTAAAAAGNGSAALTGMLAGLTLAFAAAFWWAGGGRGDLAAVIGARPDERQSALDLRATAIAGLAVMIFCLGAAIVSLARGGSGNPWAAMDAIFGVVYSASLVILRR